MKKRLQGRNFTPFEDAENPSEVHEQNVHLIWSKQWSLMGKQTPDLKENWRRWPVMSLWQRLVFSNVGDKSGWVHAWLNASTSPYLRCAEKLRRTISEFIRVYRYITSWSDSQVGQTWQPRTVGLCTHLMTEIPILQKTCRCDSCSTSVNQ